MKRKTISQLVVIVPVLVVFCVGCPAGMASTKSGQTASRLRQIETACVAFYSTYGSYPSEDNFLAELTGLDSPVVNTRRIQFVAEELMTDAWGNAFVYRCPGRNNPTSFDLYSLGEDGKTVSGGNDADDINNWSVGQPWLAHYRRTPIMKLGLALIVVMLVLFVGIGLIRRFFLSLDATPTSVESKTESQNKN